MRAWWAIVVRELRMRASVPVVALVVGIVSALVGNRVLPGFSVGDQAFVPLAACLVLVSFVALLLGWTILGEDLSSGRLAFFFARPIGWRALWGGKIAACLFLVATCASLSLLPWMASRGFTPWAVGPVADVAGWPALAGVVVFALGLAGVANLFRHAPPRVRLLHLGLATAAALLALSTMDASRYGLWALFGWGREPNVSWLLALAFLAGLAAQAVTGRADPRRGQWSMAATLWLLLAGIGGSVLVAGTAVSHASPRWLSRITWAARVAHTDWIVVAGPVLGSGYEAAFLLDPQNDRAIALGPGDREIPIKATPNGRRAFVDARPPFETSQGADRLLVADLSSGSLAEARDSLRWLGARDVSPTDDGCLFVSSGVIVSWACESDGLFDQARLGYGEASIRAPWGDQVLDPGGTIRALLWTQKGVQILGVPGRPLKGRRHRVDCVRIDNIEVCEAISGSFAAMRGDVVRYDSTGRRIVVHHRRLWHGGPSLPDEVRIRLEREAWFRSASLPDEVRIHDGVTGATLARMVGVTQQTAGVVLPDGGMLWAAIADGRAVVRPIGPAGPEGGAIDLGPAVSVDWVGRPSSDVAYARVIAPTGPRLLRIDWRSGRVEEEPGLSVAPVGPTELSSEERRSVALPGADLFLDAAGALIDVDPATRARTVLFRPLLTRMRGTPAPRALPAGG